MAEKKVSGGFGRSLGKRLLSDLLDLVETMQSKPHEGSAKQSGVGIERIIIIRVALGFIWLCCP